MMTALSGLEVFNADFEKKHIAIAYNPFAKNDKEKTMTNEMTFEELDMVAGGNWWDTFKEGLKDFHYGFLEFIVGIDLRPRYRDEDLWDN